MADEEVFDPRGLLAALHRNYVSYVLIGGFEAWVAAGLPVDRPG